MELEPLVDRRCCSRSAERRLTLYSCQRNVSAIALGTGACGVSQPHANSAEPTAQVDPQVSAPPSTPQSVQGGRVSEASFATAWLDLNADSGASMRDVFLVFPRIFVQQKVAGPLHLPSAARATRRCGCRSATRIHDFLGDEARFRNPRHIAQPNSEDAVLAFDLC